MVARAVPGSHQAGPFELITGDHTRPYLPPNTYSGFTTLEGDSTHSKECDLLQLLYYHWSDINQTDQWRKSGRTGFHVPEMRPIGIDQHTP